MKVLLVSLVATALVSCAEQPESWSKGYPPVKPAGTVVGSPNWLQKQ